MITIEELQKVVADNFGGVLTAGQHNVGGAACVWEAYNFATGADWGDYCPDCVEPDLHQLLTRLNDSRHWAGDTESAEVLLPAVVRSLGTRGDVEARKVRSWRLADVAARVLTPAALDVARRPESAARLRALAPITDAATARAACDEARSVRADIAYAADDTYGPVAAADDAARGAADAIYTARYASASAIAATYAATYASAVAVAAAAAASAAADSHGAWRSHVGALLVAAGLKETTE